METTQDLLDALRDRAGSDRKAAALVGVTQPTFSEWRTRRTWPSDDRAVQIAELLQLDAAFVLAVVNGDRSKSKQTRAAWERVARQFGKAAALAVVSAAPFMLPAPSSLAGSLHNANSEYTMYNRRRRRFADTVLQSLGLSEQQRTA